MTELGSTRGVINTTAAAGLVALSLYLLVVGQDILMPLVLAIFIAYLVVALSHAIQKLPTKLLKLPGWAALTLAILVFILVIAILVQLIAGNIRAVVTAAPEYQDRLQDLLGRINAFVAQAMGQDQPLTFTTLLEQVDLRAVVGRFADAFQSIAGNTFQIFAYVFFLLLENRTFDRKMRAMFPDGAREKSVRETLAQIGDRIETYVLIKTFVSFLTGVASYVVLRIAGVDFAAFWALLIFVLNFIPYIGSPIGMLFPTVLTLLQFGSPLTAVIVLGCLIAVQTLVENVIEPRLMGSSLNLSPVFMILSLSIWGAIWGITGMILAVPMMVLIMIVLAQFPATRGIAAAMSETGEIDSSPSPRKG